ncbi:sigma-E factor negative regulatory protein [Duganella sp. Leaf61]|uniref:sigma-E factor negative regulatory protein n=1 Tax=Duganella sp. Leaf61 TaxID=1736227 RepID=UPI0009E7E34C|nr:RseA family anti-sigma factor [Duganella sp. Leaf61]
MDTHKRLHENISALADGELAQSEQELAFAALETAEGRAAWQAYHLVGDVLRDSAQGALSSGFRAALAARLDNEPAHELSPLAPGATDPAAPPFAASANGAAAAHASNANNNANVAAANALATSAAASATSHGQDAPSADVIFP